MSRSLLTELCSVPTAPFVEHRVVAFIERFAAKRPRLRLSRDEWGNLLLELPGTNATGNPHAGRKTPRWVYTAHMDHPGFVAQRMIDATTLEAAFHGWVLEEYFRGQPVRFFDGKTETAGTIVDYTLGTERKVPKSVRLRVKRAVTPGAIGMWDQGEGREKDGKFYSRVCDDLAGAAAAMAMLDQLHRRPPVSTVAVLFTRAEEEGFIGAVGASLKPKLIKRSDNLIAIETSAMQPYAPQGKGAIIRIGDKTSVFNSDLSYFITQQAEALKKEAEKERNLRERRAPARLSGKDSSAPLSFQFQRALMPGGTCEATIYDAYGFKAASICVPLGNYHNMDAGKKRIGPEYIDLSDWDSMVKLFVKVAREGHTHEPGMKPLKARVEKRFKELEKLLENPVG